MSSDISFEEYLNTHGSLTYSNVGTSMLPLLRQGRDLFTLAKKGEGRCRAGDVVLYRRPPNRYVLHRIVEVREQDYVILGDNCVTREYGITDQDIIAVMTGFVHRGRPHTVDDAAYKAYTFIWMHTIPPRIALKRAIHGAKRRLKRLIGYKKA